MSSYCWIAFKDRDKSEILDALGLDETDTWEDTVESSHVTFSLPNEWIVVQTNDFDPEMFDLEVVSCLSEDGGEIYHCIFSSSGMTSALAYCQDGNVEWVISHVSDNGNDHFEVDGELSDFAQNELNTLLSHPLGPDECRIDIAPDLANFLIGYHAERAMAHGEQLRYQVLEKT